MASRAEQRVLGIDPGLHHTGWGLIAFRDNRMTHLGHGTITTSAGDGIAARLRQIYDGLRALLETGRPDEAAIEEVFVNRNPQSSLKLGEARGVALLAIAEIPHREHATRLVKKAVVGTGRADKQQVAAMVGRLLPGCGPLREDESDALAVAIAHVHLRATAARIATSA